MSALPKWNNPPGYEDAAFDARAEALGEKVDEALLAKTPAELCEFFGLDSQDLFHYVTGQSSKYDRLLAMGVEEAARRLGVQS